MRLKNFVSKILDVQRRAIAEALGTGQIEWANRDVLYFELDHPSDQLKLDKITAEFKKQL